MESKIGDLPKLKSLCLQYLAKNDFEISNVDIIENEIDETIKEKFVNVLKDVFEPFILFISCLKENENEKTIDCRKLKDISFQDNNDQKINMIKPDFL